MKLKIARFLTVVLVSQLIVQPAFAADYGRRTNVQASAQAADSSGMSFRKSDIDTLLKNQAQDNMEQDVISKGLMMQDPSIAGLVYQIHILGEVKNPGTYRIAASDRLSEVLLRAGGVSQSGSQRNIEVRRTGEGTRKIDLLAFQLKGNLADNPYLLDNDVVYVPLRRGTIQVVGAVLRPRDYEIRREKTLRDAIELAGGVSVGATRDAPIKVVRFVDNKKDIIDVPQTETDIASFQIQNGDVIFVPHMITEKNKFDFDLPKLPGDNIFYPSFEDRVFILGGVEAPGPYPFNPYYNISQYLSLASGYTKLSTKKIHIINPEGKKTKVHKKNIDTVTINPGDTILVGERRIAPEGWMSIIIGIAGFGLSTTSTVMLLTNRY